MDLKAMNLTFGDFLIIEIALVHYIKELDLSMQSGQFITELLGKIEYSMAQLKLAEAAARPGGLQPPPEIPLPAK